MAYLCEGCIGEHGLGCEATFASCIGFCEVCQPVFFGGIRPGWQPKHTVWVPSIVRSLDDPEAIPRQLAARRSAITPPEEPR